MKIRMSRRFRSSPQKEKKKKKIPYVRLDFQNGVLIDTLVDSGAYVDSAIAENELHRKKQEAPTNILKNDYPPNF